MTRDRQFQARWRAWNALPFRDRAIFASVRIDGLDYDEAARCHDCTVQDVEQVIVHVSSPLWKQRMMPPP